MKQRHLFISGFVQGVGFRQFVKSQARKLGLSGVVRNLPDGRVEVVAQGTEEALTELEKHCQKGPLLSEVEHIEAFWEEVRDISKEFIVQK